MFGVNLQALRTDSGDDGLHQAFVAFQEVNPNYRIEDPTWSGYSTWLKDAPLV